MTPCPNIIVTVASSRILNMKEISNHILAVKFVEEKEDHIVHIPARRFVIKENANLVSMREHWFRVNVGKAQD